MALIKTRQKICEYIGESYNNFHKVRKEEKLPVWQTGGNENSTWKARSEDLDKWIDEQAEKYLPAPA